MELSPKRENGRHAPAPDVRRGRPRRARRSPLIPELRERPRQRRTLAKQWSRRVISGRKWTRCARGERSSVSRRGVRARRARTAAPCAIASARAGAPRGSSLRGTSGRQTRRRRRDGSHGSGRGARRAEDHARASRCGGCARSSGDAERGCGMRGDGAPVVAVSMDRLPDGAAASAPRAERVPVHRMSWREWRGGEVDFVSGEERRIVRRRRRPKQSRAHSQRSGGRRRRLRLVAHGRSSNSTRRQSRNCSRQRPETKESDR